MRAYYAGDELVAIGDVGLLQEMALQVASDRITLDIAICDFLDASSGDSPDEMLDELAEYDDEIDRRRRQSEAIRNATPAEAG